MSTKNIRLVPQDEINSIVSRQGRTWVDVGMLLDKVEDTKAWEGEASSFSEWLRSFSNKLGLGEAGIWRQYTAFRFYKSLEQRYKELTFPIPQNLHKVTNPDSLELLTRLERVMTKQAFIDLTQKALDGFISRAKLRKLWDEYRPILEGKTARGNPNDLHISESQRIEYFGSEFEEDLFLLLQQDFSPLVGRAVTGAEFSLFRDVDLGTYQHTDYVGVVMSSDSNHDGMDFHGIETRLNERPMNETIREVSEPLDEYLPLFDFVWAATDPGSVEYCIESIPEEIGVLTIIDHEVKIFRAAKRQVSAETSAVAKSVLKAVLRK